MAYEERVHVHRIAIDAAKAAGVKRVVYSSLAFAGPPDRKELSVAFVQKAHIDTEAYIKASGLEYTNIRMGIYTESWSLYAGFLSSTDVKQKGQAVCVVPNDGPIAWTARDELGEATAAMLENVSIV